MSRQFLLHNRNLWELNVLNFSTIQLDIINGTIAKLLSSLGGVILLGLGSILVINHQLSIG